MPISNKDIPDNLINEFIESGGKWAHYDGKNPTIIQWTFNLSSAVQRLKDGDVFSGDGDPYKLSINNVENLQTPFSYLRDLIYKSITKWQASGYGNIILQEVPALTESQGGIVIATCGTYAELSYSAFTSPRFANRWSEFWQQFNFKLICLPNDYHKHDWFITPGGQAYIKKIIAHEFGHTLGLKHLSPALKKFLLSMGESGCNQTVMGYSIEVCQPFIDCVKNHPLMECHEKWSLTVPGPLDQFGVKYKYQIISASTVSDNIFNKICGYLIDLDTFKLGLMKGFLKEIFLNQSKSQANALSEAEIDFAIEGILTAGIALVSPLAAVAYFGFNRIPKNWYIDTVSALIAGTSIYSFYNSVSFFSGKKSYSEMVTAYVDFISGGGYLAKTAANNFAGSWLGEKVASCITDPIKTLHSFGSYASNSFNFWKPKRESIRNIDAPEPVVEPSNSSELAPK